MARALHSEFGPEIRSGRRATCGGDLTDCVKDVNKYKPAVGPTSQMQQGPGIHGTNHGNSGTQGRR